MSSTVRPAPARLALASDHVRPNTLAELFLVGAAQTPNAVALERPDGDGRRRITYAELGTTIREIALGFIALGIAPGDRVALLAATCPGWTLVNGGIACAGATVVPIYHTNSPEECRYAIEHSGARAVVCEDAAQLAKIERIRAACPALEHVVLMTGAAPEGVIGLTELRARGAAADPAALGERLAGAQPSDPATIVYTSGTTGPPKGCVLTHANLLATVEMYVGALELPQQPVVFLFLPLAHSLARVTQLATLTRGGTLAFWRGDPALLLDDVALTRPTHLPVVPRVLEKIRARALDAADAGGAPRRALLAAALALGRRAAAHRHAGEALPPPLRVAHGAADRLVLSRVRRLFGDRIEQVLTGAAPIAPDVLRFFDACGIAVYEGYGMTETCAAATLNTPRATRIGTVGRALPGVGVRIAADAEVLLRGPNVFPGYWHDETATRATIDADGWLRTGDLGALDADGYLRITGRKKDLIITSSGKNVTPSNVEAALREIRWVGQAVIYGDRRPYLVAALTLDPDEVAALGERVGLPEPDAAALAADPRVRELLAEEVEAVNAGFARIEQVKRFALLPRDFTQADGELTPTLKLRRAAVYDRYAATFADLYEDAAGG